METQTAQSALEQAVRGMRMFHQSNPPMALRWDELAGYISSVCKRDIEVVYVQRISRSRRKTTEQQPDVLVSCGLNPHRFGMDDFAAVFSDFKIVSESAYLASHIGSVVHALMAKNSLNASIVCCMRRAGGYGLLAGKGRLYEAKCPQ